IARWNDELRVSSGAGQHFLFDWSFRKKQPDVGTVSSRLAVWSVVHLKTQNRARLNQLGRTLGKNLGLLAGCEPSKLEASGCPVPFAAGLLVTGFLNEDYDVMNNFPV